MLSPISQQGGDKRGHVAVVLNFMEKVTSDNVYYLEDAEVVLTGKENYQWFGYDALCTNDGTLVVSSPGKRTALNEQAAGAVYGYDIKTKAVKFALESTEDQTKFGLSLSYNPEKNLLAVGAPARNYGLYMYHAGAAFIFDLGSSNLTFANPKVILYSGDRGARFGKRLLWVNSEDLVVSAPSFTTYNTVGVSNEQGMVYYFSRVDGLNGQYSNLWATSTFFTEEAGCRHGDTLGFSQAYNKLLVGSPFCHNYPQEEGLGGEQRIAGRLYFFQGKSATHFEREATFLA